VQDVVRRKGRDGQIAARDLVLALGPCLDARDAMGDRVVDRAVIAKLEMQEGRVHHRAPVAPVQRIGAAQVQGAGHGLPVALGQHEHDAIAKPFAKQRPEAGRQVGGAPALVHRRQVEAMERVPERGRRRAAQHGAEGEAALRRLPPLAPDLLALARRQRAKERIEIGIARVVPVELHALAQQPAGLREGGPLRAGAERHVAGGDADAPRRLGQRRREPCR
jgi:hypothetical protein